jgi:hypothetical protein
MILVLQHPQEPREPLSSAGLFAVVLNRLGTEFTPKISTGLSWPNLKKASGLEIVTPSRWIVFYLGSHVPKARSPDDFIDWIKPSAPPAETELAEIEGIVLLDGTWKQAKTLWWRNPWLLKLRRAALAPKAPSLYGLHRREPRRECLSTFESGVLALQALDAKGAISPQWVESAFSEFKKFVESKQWMSPERPRRPHPNRDRRRRT